MSSPRLLRAATPAPARSLRFGAAFFAVALLGVLGACSDDPSGPEIRPDDRLNVVVQAPAAPTLSAITKSVWVKRGQDADIRLFYRPLVAGGDSSYFVRLRFDENTLLARPNGTPIAVGDSVLVTITAPDPTKFLVHLEPTGLRFNPNAPAELQWELIHKDDDLDDDGDVDATDASLNTQLSIWRQENASQPWARLASRIEIQLDEIEVELTGFSNYVVAY